MRANESIIADAIKGAAAGAVGGWAIDKVTSYMWEHESPAARQKYEEVTGGKYAPDRLAEKAEKLLGLTLSDEQRQRLAQAMHQGIGIGMGVAYALLRRVKGADRAQGLLFGLAFWAALDEGLDWLIGAAEPPLAYPRQAHARGLVGHLAYGVAADTTLDLLDRVA